MDNPRRLEIHHAANQVQAVRERVELLRNQEQGSHGSSDAAIAYLNAVLIALDQAEAGLEQASA